METVHEGVNSSPSQKASKAGLILKIGSQVSCIMFSRQYNIFHPEVIKPLGVHRKHLVRPSVQNSCPVHIFFREKQWKFLLHRDVDYDLWVCHVLDPRYFGQCQGHWRKKWNKLCPVHIFPREKHLKFLFHTTIAYDMKVMTLTQGGLGKLNVMV